ncbi:MAG: acyl-CoA dehydrogenase family protein, partial [Proteobacteria bacterium]|nr:acyl-CoA dehydrogenase family protein [Pseudomonadota bacterium]
GSLELSLVAEACGQGLITLPIVETAVAAAVLAKCGNEALRDELVGAMVSGSHVVVPAFDAPMRAGWGMGATAIEEGDGLRVTGEKRAAVAAQTADGYLVDVEMAGGQVLCYVAADSAGVTSLAHATADRATGTTLRFSETPVAAERVLARPNTAAALIGQAKDTLRLGCSADLLGVMERALAIAIDYLKIRTQFDKPIGSFQALQHRAVNDYIAVESTRALLYQVCATIDEDSDRPGLAAAVKAKASSAAMVVTKSVIQMHGAIGYTNEHEAGWFLRRAMVLAARYGNAAANRAHFAEHSDSIWAA